MLFCACGVWIMIVGVGVNMVMHDILLYNHHESL
jgi:hypothetical protein